MAVPSTSEVDVADRSQDWYRQALRDLDQARDSQSAGRHEWACFAAHQAAKKVVKALHLHQGQEAWGHLVSRLVEELPEELPEELSMPAGLADRGRVLDNFYVPARYPNGHPEGAPFEHYGPLQSGEALRHADAIVAFAGAAMA